MRILSTDEFNSWFHDLRDERAFGAVAKRLDRITHAGRVVGDVHSVGGGVSEMRFDVGPGYRVYFAQRGDVVLLLFSGGSKRHQEHDIQRAIDMLKVLKGDGQW